jgi:hypothetical protein
MYSSWCTDIYIFMYTTKTNKQKQYIDIQFRFVFYLFFVYRCTANCALAFDFVLYNFQVLIQWRSLFWSFSIVFLNREYLYFCVRGVGNKDRQKFDNIGDRMKWKCTCTNNNVMNASCYAKYVLCIRINNSEHSSKNKIQPQIVWNQLKSYQKILEITIYFFKFL